MKKAASHLFWVSYADLLTALFVVALALFVFSFKAFKDKENLATTQAQELRQRYEDLKRTSEAMEILQSRLSKSEKDALLLIKQLADERNRLSVMETEYKKLQEIQQSIAVLNPEYFQYQPQFKRHVLRNQVQFSKGSSTIDPSYHEPIKNAGLELQRLVNELVKDANIKYLLVIEGQASKDNYARNYELSYERALALYRLWQEQGVTFDPNRVEVIISGSGMGGIGREAEEVKNQRFLIHIIPKTGEVKPVG